MTVEILASGSDGNATLLNGRMLIDCGKSFTWLTERLSYKLPDAILLMNTA